MSSLGHPTPCVPADPLQQHLGPVHKDKGDIARVLGPFYHSFLDVLEFRVSWGMRQGAERGFRR